MAHYFIGIGLPPKEEAFFGYVKSLFPAKRGKKTPAHITLAAPFNWDNEEILIKSLNDWAKSQQQFPAEFSEVENFWQIKYGTIYLSPNNTEAIERLRQSLLNYLAIDPKRDDFIPHLTIANGVDFDQIEPIKNTLKQMEIMIKLKIKSVILYKLKPENGWNRIREIKFGR